MNIWRKYISISLIPNFRRVKNFVRFLRDNSPGVSILYVDDSEHCLFHLHRQTGLKKGGTDSVPKRRHIEFRRRGITPTKANKVFNLMVVDRAS